MTQPRIPEINHLANCSMIPDINVETDSGGRNVDSDIVDAEAGESVGA